MTGYGRGTAETGGLRVAAEVKSLNNRFADLRLRLPAELQSEEVQIRRQVLSRVRRGRIELSLTVERSDPSASAVGVNRALLEAALSAARMAREEFGLPGELDVNTLLSVPDLLQRSSQGAGLSVEELQAVRRALDAALDALDAERRREGEVLRGEILARTGRMRALVEEVRRLAGEIPQAVQRKLLERLEALLQSIPVDPARLAQEAAFLADRCDVTEELVRLASHIDQAAKLLSEPDEEPLGKRLDFLLQEIHRETNTINSKSGDLEIGRHALALKSEAEKIREQIQNLE